MKYDNVQKNSIPKSHRDELDRRFKEYVLAPGELLTLKDLQELIEEKLNRNKG